MERNGEKRLTMEGHPAAKRKGTLTGRERRLEKSNGIRDTKPSDKDSTNEQAPPRGPTQEPAEKGFVIIPDGLERLLPRESTDSSDNQ